MPANYAALRDRTVAAIDKLMAEPIRLSFLKGGSVDPARPARDIEAPLRTGDGKSSAAAPGGGAGWRGRISAQKAELHVDLVKYPNLDLRVGDTLCATSRPGKPWWQVLGIDSRGHTRRIYTLGEI